jgi:hypothetical protein
MSDYGVLPVEQFEEWRYAQEAQDRLDQARVIEERAERDLKQARHEAKRLREQARMLDRESARLRRARERREAKASAE